MDKSKEVRILVLGGLNNGKSVEQKICHISLDKENTINVIDSTPAEIDMQPATCVINNVLYAVGIGSAYNELWKWSAEGDEWTRLANLPSGLLGHCVAGVGEKIYVLGGRDFDYYNVVDSVLCYDINSDKWTQVGKINHAVLSAACVAYKHFIYVFGGSDKDQNDVDHVQVYDTSKGRAGLGSNPMPEAERTMRAVIWESKVLLIGDSNCYIYEIEQGTWEERGRFKVDQILFGLSLNDGTLYVSGGSRYTEGEDSEHVWKYSDEVKSLSVDDFISENQQAEWKHHAKLPVPCCVHFFSTQPLCRFA